MACHGGGRHAWWQPRVARSIQQCPGCGAAEVRPGWAGPAGAAGQGLPGGHVVAGARAAKVMWWPRPSGWEGPGGSWSLLAAVTQRQAPQRAAGRRSQPSIRMQGSVCLHKGAAPSSRPRHCSEQRRPPGALLRWARRHPGAGWAGAGLAGLGGAWLRSCAALWRRLGTFHPASPGGFARCCARAGGGPQQRPTRAARPPWPQIPVGVQSVWG